MLDENGQDIGSEQMAELVGDAGNTVWATSTSMIFFSCLLYAWKNPSSLSLSLSLSLSIYIYWASWWLDEVITEYDVHWQIIYLHFLINRLVISFDFLVIQCFFFRWHVNWGHLTRGILSMNRVYLEANSQKNNLISLKCTLLGTDLSGYIHHNFILFWVILGVIIHHHFSTDLFIFLNEVRWTFYPWRNFVICKVLIQHSYYPIVELLGKVGGRCFYNWPSL